MEGLINQPWLALSFELPGNAEKGLSQRFLWLFPRPIYGKFETLEAVKEEFIDNVGELIAVSVYYIIANTVT